MAPIPGDSSKHQFGTSMPQGGHPPHHSITSSARARGGTFSKMRPKQTPAVVIARLNRTGVRGMVGLGGCQQTPPLPFAGQHVRIGGNRRPDPPADATGRGFGTTRRSRPALRSAPIAPIRTAYFSTSTAYRRITLYALSRWGCMSVQAFDL